MMGKEQHTCLLFIMNNTLSNVNFGATDVVLKILTF